MSQFMLSRDTDWSDLMQFISDNRETFDYSRKDLNTIAKNGASAELDFTFLGFEDIYKDVLNFAPKDKMIIDLGCGYAAQSYYFREHEKYIGVDACGNSDTVIHTENSEFYFMSIQDFIKDVLPVLGIDPKDVFAVCSYVPDKAARELVAGTFPYCRVYYPGEISVWKLPERTPQATPRFQSGSEPLPSACQRI